MHNLRSSLFTLEHTLPLPAPPSMSPSPQPTNPYPLSDLVTSSGRMKRNRQDPFVKLGGKYVRTIDMFQPPAAVVQFGLRLVRSDDEELTPEQERMLIIYEELVTSSPHFEQELNSFANVSSICHSLQQGCCMIKANDTDSIKKRLPSWWEKLRGFDAPQIPAEKVLRGFNNPVTGALLCPIDLDWNDPVVQQSLRDRTATIDGQPVDGSDWPTFLYGDVYDPNLPWMSFLRGPLLVMGYRHVFISPSSNNQNHIATNTTNAMSYGMNEVTPPSIAYIATQIYFALTDFPTFSRNSKALDAQTLFNSLIEHMQDPDFFVFNEDLLQWWNRQIFPRAAANCAKVFSSRSRIRAKLEQYTSNQVADSESI